MTPELLGMTTALAIDVGLLIGGLYLRGKPKWKVLGTVLVVLGVLGFIQAARFLIRR
jgi:hypothetical protein